MNDPLTISSDEAEMTRLASPPQTDPVLLVLPMRQSNCPPPDEDTIHLLETGSEPRFETALLRELLARSPQLAKCLADSTEPLDSRHPLAGINAYKHRLHALRCENVNLRLRVHDLETQLNRMRATRGWQVLQKYRRWRRIVFRWLQPIFKIKNHFV